MKQGTAQSRYAKMLLERGVSYGEILQDSAMQGFSPATLRTIARRMKQANETGKLNGETIETGNETGKVMKAKKADLNVENDVSPVSFPVSNAFQSVSFWRQFAQVFHPADLLYYSGVSLAGVGIIGALHLIGYVLAGVYFAVAIIALHGIKTMAGWQRAPHFVIMAIVEAGGFASHTVWANKALWADVAALPLDIWVHRFKNDLGEMQQIYMGTDVKIPGTIALGVAGFMLACTAYVVWIAIQNSKK